MSSMHLLIGGAAAALIAGAVGGYTVRGWQCDAALLEAKQRAEDDQKLIDALAADASEEHAASSAAAQSAGVVRERTIREIYRDVKVPASCDPPAALVGVLGEAVAEANTRVAGEPQAAVPATGQPAQPTR